MNDLIELSGVKVLVCAADGPAIDGARAATDLVGEALSAGAAVIALPTGRLPPAFFQLRTGLAGEVAQKVVNYRLKLAIIGDVSAAVAASSALRDWLVECDRGGQVLFTPTLEALAARLAAG